MPPPHSTPAHSGETAINTTSMKTGSIAEEKVSYPILESLAEQTAGHLLQTRAPSGGGDSGVPIDGLPSQQLVEGVISLLCHVTLG